MSPKALSPPWGQTVSALALEPDFRWCLAHRCDIPGLPRDLSSLQGCCALLHVKLGPKSCERPFRGPCLCVRSAFRLAGCLGMQGAFHLPGLVSGLALLGLACRSAAGQQPLHRTNKHCRLQEAQNCGRIAPKGPASDWRTWSIRELRLRNCATRRCCPFRESLTRGQVAPQYNQVKPLESSRL